MLIRSLCVILILTTMYAATRPAASWPSIKPLVNTLQIEDVSRDRFKALQARDDSSFERYYTPNFQMTTAWGTSEDITFLERWIKTAPPGFSLKPTNYHVTVSADGEMGFATFQVLETYPDSSGTSPTVIMSRYTEIYVHHRSGWFITEAHFSYQTKQST